MANVRHRIRVRVRRTKKPFLVLDESVDGAPLCTHLVVQPFTLPSSRTMSDMTSCNGIMGDTIAEALHQYEDPGLEVQVPSTINRRCHGDNHSSALIWDSFDRVISRTLTAGST